MIPELKNRLNIKELYIPEKENRHILSFDPEFEFTADVWTNAVDHLVNYTFSTTFVEGAGQALYLAPGSIDLDKLKVPSQTYKSKIIDMKKGYLVNFDPNLSNFPRYYFFAHKLYPENEDIFLNKDKVHNKTNEYIKQNNKIPLFYATLLYPEVKKEVPKTEAEWLRGRIQTLKELEMFRSLATDATEAKILAPDVLAENPITIDEWMHMKEALHDLANNHNWTEFLEMAFNMYIISAGEIKSHNGLLDIKPQSNRYIGNDRDNLLPAVRRF
jgi:hypothetical protein